MHRYRSGSPLPRDSKSGFPVSPPNMPNNHSRLSHGHHTGGEPDDVSHLTLSEVRDRLARNQRVLNMVPSAISPSNRSPTAETSPTINYSSPSTSPPVMNHRRSPASTSPETPVRQILLSARAQLLERERELMVEQARKGLSTMNMDSKEAAAESSGSWRQAESSGGAGRSGKQRALAVIQLSENPNKKSMILPVRESLALGERDFDNQTALQMASISLNHQNQGLPINTRFRRQPAARILPATDINGYSRVNDEISEAQQAARLNAFMRHKAVVGEDEDEGDQDEDMFDEDDKYRGEEEREYDANGMPLDPSREEEDATEERADLVDGDTGEDGGGMFMEGNDEYGTGNGLETLGAGPDDAGDGRNVILSEK